MVEIVLFREIVEMVIVLCRILGRMRMRGAGKAQGEKGLTNDDYEPNLCCGVLVCFNLSVKRRLML